MFAVLCDHASKEAFFVIDDDGAPKLFPTEAEAISSAKEYCGSTLVLRATARVTDVTKYKVEKLK